MELSARAKIITRRTYNRPLDEDNTQFETWEQTVDRVIQHQRWLWERAKTHNLMPEIKLKDVKIELIGEESWQFLTYHEEIELAELRQLLLEKKLGVSGRTLWLGGTWVSQNREASQFNCAFTNVETVYDIVDVFWLLLQGCGVGFRPVAGTLTGFKKRIPELQVIRSEGRTEKGVEHNEEFWDAESRTWTIKLGDSAEAWAKSLGKILACKYPARKLILDYTEIRKAGVRLKNYGWISQGDKGISAAYEKIFQIMNAKADCLLSEMDILDIVTLMGTILSTRRSAEIAVLDEDNPCIQEFANAKVGIWEEGGKSHRAQSNNSIIFWKKPTKDALLDWFNLINEGGNGEPGLINGKAMKSRAPWAVGLNPCAEILLPNKGFCNLVTIPVDKFRDDFVGMLKAMYLATRANYRQTVVDLRDGVLQEAWHLNNEHLRLCGASLMGITGRPDMGYYEYARLQRVAVDGAYSMARELELQYPKNVTAIKPEGTQSKCYDVEGEGMHKPLGEYILNNVAFSVHDPLLDKLKAANYRVFNHPYDSSAALVTFPVHNKHTPFELVKGKRVNLESAVDQLERYKMLMSAYCQQNVSCTISYDKSETDEIVDWLYNNWDSYVAVSFLFRNDPTKTAADLGYPYLPQEVVDKETWEAYSSKLLEVDIDSANSEEELMDDECAGGVCPIR